MRRFRYPPRLGLWNLYECRYAFLWWKMRKGANRSKNQGVGLGEIADPCCAIGEDVFIIRDHPFLRESE
jgi:hypothetical protein